MDEVMVAPETVLPLQSSLEMEEQRAHRVSDVRGWLLFFCVTLMLVTPVFALYTLFGEFNAALQLRNQLPRIVPIVTVEFVLMLAQASLGFLAGLGLLTAHRHAVRNAQWFLQLQVLNTLVLAILPFTLGLPTSANDALTAGALASVRNGALYFTLWYSYLTRSKRVGTTYAQELANPQSGVRRYAPGQAASRGQRLQLAAFLISFATLSGIVLWLALRG